MNIVVSPVTATDIEPLAALARVVWQRTYPEIISQAQIDFMLEQRYNPRRVRQELDMPGVWWEQARVDGELVGFASCLLTAAGREMKLDKLYVDPNRQRMGIGERLLREVRAHARREACDTLILAVNKRNAPAIAAYRKHGFTVREAVRVDIGEGFVMDDFIMAQSLLPAVQ
ncbi:MAG TPA: GNAT family N-acetyltransferase [Accumulibacter sp.]|jgi:ribosomal protein S18 acetylase RimI-like enzyme|nr:GNAT family N-acetyltransferase [Accumulibacter sp.]HQC79260.1 GNAT family N-acetyltransferase [Accumulibacter sp.]